MLDNPFTYGNPISDSRRFFGRAREVEQIFGRLRNDEFESSSLVGDRRIGKTSLLNYLADPSVRTSYSLSPERYIFVYVDLQMVDESMGPEQLWRRLLALMRRHCDDEGVVEILGAFRQDDRLDTFALDELFEQSTKADNRLSCSSMSSSTLPPTETSGPTSTTAFGA